jgi:pimeloyl-ACP methyl ester carboxylesterase
MSNRAIVAHGGRKVKQESDRMLTMLVILPLLATFCLLLDAAAGRSDWQGLRLTRLRPLWAFVAATLITVAWVVWQRGAPISFGPILLAAALSLPIYLLLALFTGRSVTPDAWTSAGEWPAHAVAAVSLPAGEGSIPALLYTPKAGARGVMALVHGAGAHKSFYTWPLVEALLDAGCAVCAIDLDGHGDNRRVLDFPGVLEDVTATVAWLRQHWAFVGVAGISLGGCISARAIAEGLDVDALALFEAPLTVEVTPRVRRHEYWTLLRWGAWRLHRFAGVLPIIRSWETAPTRGRIGTVDLIERLDLLGSLRRIRVPFWLCYGMSDWVVPMSQVRAIEAAAPPGTPLVVVPRATHLSLPLDRRALRALQIWLEELTPQPASTAPANFARPTLGQQSQDHP